MTPREAQLEAALKDVFAMIDEGLLVRNTAFDHEPEWAMQALRFTQRLQKAYVPVSEGITELKR